MVVYQPARGFRYGAEAFWLVGFALEGGPARSALDLGTGSGVAALLLARAGIDTLGLDVRPEWAPGWERSLAESAVPAAVRLVRGDVREARPGPVDLVVSNPPFFAAGSGPVAPDAWKAAARTEASATLADFVSAALASLDEGGRACFVVPVDRQAELIRAASAQGAHPSRGVRVGRRRVLLELRAGQGSPVVPEILDETDPRVRAWYAAAGARPTAR